MPKIRFTADLPPDLYDWIEKYAKGREISRNVALAEAVEKLRVSTNAGEDE